MLNISISLFSLRAVPSISQSYHEWIVSLGRLIAPLKITAIGPVRNYTVQTIQRYLRLARGLSMLSWNGTETKCCN